MEMKTIDQIRIVNLTKTIIITVIEIILVTRKLVTHVYDQDIMLHNATT